MKPKDIRKRLCDNQYFKAENTSMLALLAEKDEEIEKLRNSKQNLGVALGKMTVKFANSFDRAEEAEIKESTGALEIILLKNKLQAAEQKVAAMQAVLDAAKVIAKWMEFWLHEDLCECEDTHSCGKLERRAELLSYHDAVDAMEVSDEY